MALALMINQLNAENFNSSNAAEGAVLTANGTGGASWEAAAERFSGQEVW